MRPQGTTRRTRLLHSAGFDNAPLHALANGSRGPDGVYLYTAAPGAFPTNTYDSANYWVDVLFAPSATYSVSGTVSGASGAGATVQLGGSVSVTTTADGSGNYKFLNVPARHVCSDADQRHWICARHSDGHRIAVQHDRRELQHVAAMSLQFHLDSPPSRLPPWIQTKRPPSNWARSSRLTLTGTSSASASTRRQRIPACMWQPVVRSCLRHRRRNPAGHCSLCE